MMKAKHYVYARVITAIVSTSTMAGTAMRMDVLDNNTSKSFFNRLSNTVSFFGKSEDPVQQDLKDQLSNKTGHTKNNVLPVITPVETVIKNNTTSNGYTSMFKNYFFGASKPEVETVPVKVLPNPVVSSIGTNENAQTIDDLIDDFEMISIVPDLSSIKPAASNAKTVVEPAVEQQSDMPATPVHVQMNHIASHHKPADKSSYDAMDLDDVVAAQTMSLDSMMAEYQDSDNPKVVTLDFDNAGHHDKEALIAGYTLDNVKRFAALAKLSYSNFKNRNETLLRYQTQGYNISHFGTSAENSGFVMIKGREVIVSYHGTESMRNLATDFWATMNTSSFTSGRFHSGFYEGFKKTWDEIYAVIHAHADHNNLKLTDLKLNFTGHSLGGALAGIGATRWAERVNKDNVSLISFAAPKFCDTEAARRVTELFGDRILRITQHAFDIVPSVGPGILGFTQVGANLHITAECWTDMHSMKAYERKVVSLSKDKYVSSDHVYQIFNGGYYNPLNIIDGAIKYGLHERVLSPVHKRISKARKWAFGSSAMIEDVLNQNDENANKKFQEILKLNCERNIKLLQDDKLALESEKALLKNVNTDLNPGLLKKIKENDIRHQLIVKTIHQKENELKKIPFTRLKNYN